MIKLTKPLNAFLLTAVCTAVVVAGTLRDLRFHSHASLDNTAKDSLFDTRLDDLSVRKVASSADNKIKIPLLFIPMNNKNIKRINGKWKITRFLDKNDNEEKLDLIVEFKLVGDSFVMINGEEDQVFGITFLSEQNTIGLVKSLNDGFEIIEAVKLKEKKRAPKPPVTRAKVQKSSKDTNQVKGLIPQEVIYLKVKTVLFPKKSKHILQGNKVEGSLKIEGDVVEDFSLSIYLENEELRIDLPFIQLNHGGQFSEEGDEGTISGILTNNGKKGHYRIRFATGKLAGAFLNLVPEDEYQDNYQQDNYDERDSYELEKRSSHAAEMVREKLKKQNRAQELRDQQNSIKEEEMNVENIRPEEMARIIKNSGFNFQPITTNRSIASE